MLRVKQATEVLEGCEALEAPVCIVPAHEMGVENVLPVAYSNTISLNVKNPKTSFSCSPETRSLTHTGHRAGSIYLTPSAFVPQVSRHFITGACREMKSYLMRTSHMAGDELLLP